MVNKSKVTTLTEIRRRGLETKSSCHIGTFLPFLLAKVNNCATTSIYQGTKEGERVRHANALGGRKM